MRADITPGQTSDHRGFDLVMGDDLPAPAALLGDKGQDANPIRARAEARDAVPVIPMRRGRKARKGVDRTLHALRNRIERTIGRLKHSRRLATRCRQDRRQPPRLRRPRLHPPGGPGFCQQGLGLVEVHRRRMEQAARRMMASKVRSSVSERRAMRLTSSGERKKLSIGWRRLWTSRSMRWPPARRLCGSIAVLGAASADLVEGPVRIAGPIGDRRAERHAVDPLRHRDRVRAGAGQQAEANPSPQRVGERDDPGRRAALRATDGPTGSPPFAPWPWRWTRTMGASTIARSMSTSTSLEAPSTRANTPLSRRSARRRQTELPLPNPSGRSRRGLLVRTIHNTASRTSRPSGPVRPGSLLLPKQERLHRRPLRIGTNASSPDPSPSKALEPDPTLDVNLNKP